MRKLCFFPSCLVFFAIGLSAQTPGFDCSKAATLSEKAICASPKLSKADGEMTAAYRALLAAAPPATRAEIRQSQSAWLRERDAQCKMAVSVDLMPCLLASESERTDTLKGTLTSRNGVTFLSNSISLTAPDSPEVAASRKDTDQPPYGTLDASWPQALANTPEWTAWNKAILEAVLNIARADESNKPATQWQKSWAADQDAQISVDFNAVTNSLVAVSITLFWDGHTAAHPDEAIVQFNWLLKAQRAVKVEDLFRPQSNWLQQLSTRTFKYMQTQLKENGENAEPLTSEDAEDLRDMVADPANWQIDEKGITIVFRPHGRYGLVDPFTMSWESLKPLLNPAFPVPTQ